MQVKLALLKTSFVTVTVATLLNLNTTFSHFFGANYDATKDYACCRENKLVIEHYYCFKLFFISLYDGFTEEKVSVQSKDACDIKCGK